MTTALDYRKQKSPDKPTKSFGKAMSIYAKGQKKDAVSSGDNRLISTDFNELIRLQLERSEKHRKATNRFIGWLGFGLVLFLLLYLSYSLGVLS